MVPRPRGQVDERLVVGARGRLRQALERSEYSTGLNTAYIERLNLTIRHSSAYRGSTDPLPRTLLEATGRSSRTLRCFYNFIQSHRALTFGKAIRTPAMQASLASRGHSFRDSFMCVAALCPLLISIVTPRRADQNSCLASLDGGSAAPPNGCRRAAEQFPYSGAQYPTPTRQYIPILK